MADVLISREHGSLCRKKFVKYFENKWGKYQSLGNSSYKFSSGQKVFIFYSNLNYDRWWFGVSKKYWGNWDEHTNMVLLMREGKKCSYVILNSTDSKKLLNRIQPAQQDQKHINVRIPSGPGGIYIQEWKDFPFEKNIISIGNIELPKPPVEIFLERFKAMSAEEQLAVLENLENRIARDDEN